MSVSTEIENILALSRIAADACAATGPEEALWCITRNIPALLGDASAAARPGAFRDTGPLAATSAAVAFMRTPDGRHHLITAPVNFLPEQHHELVDIALGHPGEIAHSGRSLLLRERRGLSRPYSNRRSTRWRNKNRLSPFMRVNFYFRAKHSPRRGSA